MSQEALLNLTNQAVADYGFRLALMWGTNDVVARTGLTKQEADILRSKIIPELKQLPNPVEPGDLPTVQARLAGLAT